MSPERVLTLGRPCLLDGGIIRAMVQAPRSHTVRGPARLLILSSLMLFVELALIRWLGSNVVFLGFFSNFVLLGSFLGIGLGFLRCEWHDRFFPNFPVLFALFVALVLAVPAAVEANGSEIVYVGIKVSGLPPYVILPLIFTCVAALLSAIAMEVAAAFKTFSPLTAYRLDISGSLLGIGLFSALSFLEAPPSAWGAIVVVAYVALMLPRRRLLPLAACMALVGMLIAESFTPGVAWSPYYKITVKPRDATSTLVLFNGVPYQLIESYQTMVDTHQFNLVPYDHVAKAPDPAHDDVLIIGAGNGKDVEAALQRGATSVEAVDIDPRSVQLGRELNSDHPYDDPRVHVTIADGRSFLEHTDRHFDLIEFAGTDSVTVVLGQSSLRLESYLFTAESMRAVRAHLKPNGVFTAFNAYWQQWYVDRVGATLDDAFGFRPCYDFIPGSVTTAVFTTGSAPTNVHCDAPWEATTQPVAGPVSDNAPFPYLRDPGIPAVILGTILAILLFSALLIGAAARPLRSLKPYLDLAAMGAAFLLLETKNVVQFSLLFGTTWVVNALVFAGVLVAVLAAIEVAQRVRVRSLGMVYALLLLSLTVAWFVPLDTLLALDFGWRLLAATVYSFTPIFLANLVFAERFRDTSNSTTAFAANLLGAMVGGTLEYVSLAIGYRNLLIVVALLYGLAFLAWRQIRDTGGKGGAALPI